METREEYTITSPDQTNKLLALPSELYDWYKERAKIEDRSASAVMREALRAYRAARDIT